MSTLTEALKAVNGRIDDQAGVTRKGFADQKLQADSMGSDIRVVRERVDDTNVRITSLSQEVEALREAVSAIPVMTTAAADPAAAGTTPTGEPVDPAAPPPGGTTPAPPVSGAPAPAPPPVTPPPTAGSPTRLYDMAWADYTAGSYDLAIRASRATCGRSRRASRPTTPSATSAELLPARQLPEAVDAYNRVISTYPRSDVIGNAYYKRGLSYERMNQPERSRADYEYVMKTAADTDAGRLAKQRLDALNRARPQ